MVTLDSDPNGYRLTIIKNGRAMTECLSHADWERLKESAEATSISGPFARTFEKPETIKTV